MLPDPAFGLAERVETAGGAHETMLARGATIDVSMKRGMGAARLAAVAVLVGAKLRFTEIAPGVAIFAGYEMKAANCAVSSAFGLVLMISQTAVAVV